MRTNNINSCYIHIPFCNSICTYCDFCKMYYNEEMVNEYLEALSKEINLCYKGDVLNTLYIGGGTPSCLKDYQLEKLFNIVKKLNLSKTIEFTFECNIENIEEDFLKLLKQNKVNRISIGIESFDNKILKTLGRNYKSDIIKKKICLAKKYFDNINIDLIYGINGTTLKDIKKELDEFMSLEINHISIYSLILEDNTILKINNYKEIDDGLNREMYDYIVAFLEKNNYINYEISNFSKKGYESKHNLAYWNNDKYYGFGLGASGYVSDIRYTNTRSITRYIKEDFIGMQEKQTIRIDMENFMILGLRKIKGVSKSEFKRRYNKEIKEVFDVGKLEEKGDYYYIRKDNIYISNYILEDFINI